MINYSLKQETYIEKYFRLGILSAKGWRQNLTGCPYCHDGRSKNPRSYFLFQNNEIGYQCFNCGSKHRFKGSNISSLAHFISKSSWKKVGNLLLELKKEQIFPNMDLKNQDYLKENAVDNSLELINYKEIELPGFCINLNMKENEIAKQYRKRFISNKIKAKKYLKEHGLLELSKRKKLYICLEGDYSNRLIFPIYFDNRLISFAARALFPTKLKYMYPPSNDEFNDRGKIIYGLDKIFKSEYVRQIFVTESIVDAWHFDGMAILSKNFTMDQIKILKSFNFQNKKLIFVLDNDRINKWDKDLKGAELGKIVLSEGVEHWLVSKPNFGYNIKDVCESIVKNGWLATYDVILNSIIKNSTNLVLKAKLDSVMKKGILNKKHY